MFTRISLNQNWLCSLDNKIKSSTDGNHIKSIGVLSSLIREIGPSGRKDNPPEIIRSK